MANEILEQQIDIKSNIDQAVKEFAKGFDTIEKNISKISLTDKKTEKFYDVRSKILDKQKIVLKDISKIKEIQKTATEDESKEIEKVLKKVTDLQKRIKSPIDEEQVNDLVKENDKLLYQYDEIIRKYGKQHDIKKKINDQLEKTDKLNSQMLSDTTKQEFYSLRDELMMASASLASMGTGEFAVAEDHISSLIKKVEDFHSTNSESIKKAEDYSNKLKETEFLYKKLNERANDLLFIEKRIGILKNEKVKEVKPVMQRQKDITSLSKKLQDPNLDDKKRKEINDLIAEYLDDSKQIVEESKKEVDILKDIEKLKEKGIRLSKEERNIIKEKRKLLDESMKQKGMGFFERRKAVQKIEPLKSPIAGKADELKDLSKGIKTAVKPLEAVGTTLARILPPLTVALGALSFVGFAAMMVMMQKKVMETRRQIMGLAADTGELDSMLEKSSKTGQSVSSQIDTYRVATTRYVKSLGVSVDDAQAGYTSLVKAGFQLNSVIDRTPYKKLGLQSDGFEQIFVQAQLAGKSVDEMAGYAGTLREEYGLTLDKGVEAFGKITSSARNSGMATSRFYDKVINTATGMALYGAKIDEVAGSLSGLTKNIRLPEKAAADAAARLTSHFKDLSSEQQILIGDLSGYSKNLSSVFKNLKDNEFLSQDAANALTNIGISNKAIENLKSKTGQAFKDSLTATLGTIGFDKKEIDTIQSNTDSLEQNYQIMNKLNPGEQVKATINALSTSALGLDINKSSIQDLDDSFKTNAYKLQKIGEVYGYSREDTIAISELVSGLRDNSDIQAKLKEQKDKGTFNPKKFIQDLKVNNSVLYDKLANSGIDMEKLIKGIDVEKIVNGLDTNFTSLTDANKKIEDIKDKKVKTEQVRQMRQSTQSFVDAIEQSIQKVLLDIFAVLEPGFNFVVSLLKKGWSILRGGFSGLMKLMTYLPGIPKEFKNFSAKLDLDNKTANAKDKYDDAINKQNKNEKQQENLIQSLSGIADRKKSGRATDEDLKNEQKYKDELKKLRTEYTARQDKEIEPVKTQLEQYDWISSQSDEQITKFLKEQEKAKKAKSIASNIVFEETVSFSNSNIESKTDKKSKETEKKLVVQRKKTKYDEGYVEPAQVSKPTKVSKQISDKPKIPILESTPTKNVSSNIDVQKSQTVELPKDISESLNKKQEIETVNIENVSNDLNKKEISTPTVPDLNTATVPSASTIANDITNITDKSDKSSSTANDNKTVNIYVNQNDVPTIKQVVREELHATSRR